MPRPSQPHPYSDQKALERLLILIATLVHYPGVGCPDPYGLEDSPHHHNALAPVREKWQALAQELRIDHGPNYPAIATLRKDLTWLRQYGILDHRMYRWGYYLGTGVFNKRELQMALNSMQAIAMDQGDGRYRHTLEKLKKYLRGFDFGDTDPDYPIRQNLNRPVNWTDPETMMAQGAYRHTLFHCLDTLETAIWRGQVIEISRTHTPYSGKNLGRQVVWPLQLIFYNVAWYLLYQDCRSHCLIVGRMNRFADHCQRQPQPGRGLAAQRAALQQAHQLLAQGWGLNLGTATAQTQELQGQLPLTRVKIRFFHPASKIILEGEQRHPRQSLRSSRQHRDDGMPVFVDFTLKLPPRSLPEFMIWVRKYGSDAIVLRPAHLAAEHRYQAQRLLERYQDS